jgi:hypothetical protein
MDARELLARTNCRVSPGAAVVGAAEKFTKARVCTGAVDAEQAVAKVLSTRVSERVLSMLASSGAAV